MVADLGLDIYVHLTVRREHGLSDVGASFLLDWTLVVLLCDVVQLELVPDALGLE